MMLKGLSRIDDDTYEVWGKFAVDGLSGWHVVGVELDAVDGETTVHLEAFGINPNDHPDATGGIFYTTNNGSDGYSGGSPYEIKLTYTTNKTVNDVLDETGNWSTSKMKSWIMK